MTSYMGPYASVKTDLNVPSEMRDGTRLYADIYRPDTPNKHPVLLTRMPYNKALPSRRTIALDAIRAASHGYAVVVQDPRGRYASEGEFYPFMNEISDGFDSVEWCGAQSWSDGNVGMFGRSYAGATQWLAAVSRPPSLKAIVPGVTSSNYYEGWTYQGGALSYGFVASWAMFALTLGNLGAINRRIAIPEGTRQRLVKNIDAMLEESLWFLPLKEFPYLKDGLAPFFYDWLNHPTEDDYWKKVRIEDHYENIGVAALNVGGWNDIFLNGTLKNYTGMTQKGNSDLIRRGQKLIIGPWHHSAPAPEYSGEVYYGLMGSDSAIDLHGIHLKWYDYWLKGIDNGILGEAPVKLFVMGDNVWRDENEWPLDRTQYVDYYFHSRGNANSQQGDGILSREYPKGETPDVYLYDPRNPVPTTGGGLCCYPGLLRPGPFDQSVTESRHDVLVYTTSALEYDLEVTGPITVTLYASSSAPDTDFTAKLVDVCPCGCTRNLTDGIIRARYRESMSTAKLIEPGRVYEYKIDLMATSNVFKTGHKIRIDISSSNFPRFDRNPNTGREPSEEVDLKPAVQTIFHDQEYSSCITLPIIPKR